MSKLNNDIIINLKKLANYYKKIGDQFRSLAYSKAIIGINSWNKLITNKTTKKELLDITGVGKSVADKIMEFINTGKIKKVEEIEMKQKKSNKSKNILDLFENIWGVGPKKAQELYNNGFRSIEDIRKNTDLLTKNQKIGLKYYEDLLLPISREYITIFKNILIHILDKEYGEKTYQLEIAGSYRRGLPESGDIDCLISSKKFNLSQLINTLQEWKVVTEVLSMRNEKFMGIAHCPSEKHGYFRLDIEFVSDDKWASSLLYFTGSKGFNIHIRSIAKKQGYILNEHGLFKNNVKIETKNEKDIFNILGMKYINPKDRG